MPAALAPAIHQDIKLRFLKGETQAQIARATGVQPSTVKSIVFRSKTVETKALVEAAAEIVVARKVDQVLASESMRLRHESASTLARHSKLLADQRITSVKALGNTPKREGATSLLKKLVDTADVVFGWSKESGPSGVVKMDFANVIEAEEVKQGQLSDAVPVEAEITKPA